MRATCLFLRLMPAALLAACGQTGALYLPDEGIQTPVETRTATSPQPAPAPPPKAEGEDKERDQPPGR